MRLDGSLAERTTYAPLLAHPDVTGTEFAAFGQDRWRVNDRLMFELGFRIDNDDIVDRANFSPRAGVSVSVLPEGRGILRGGIGQFAERTPLTVGAFTQYEAQTVTRFAGDGQPLGLPMTFAHAVDGIFEDAGEPRADGGVGPAVRPSLLLQGGVSPSQRLARLHPRA